MRLFSFVAAALAFLSIPAYAAGAPPHWDEENARALLDYAAAIDSRGLEPSGYDTMALTAALANDDAAAAGIAAAAVFRKIAVDLSSGATPVHKRGLWRFAAAGPDETFIDNAMNAALMNKNVAAALDSFSPPNEDYRKLFHALPSASNDAERALIRRNMERWRWIPRDLGRDYVLVNVPAYEAVIVRGGKERLRRKVVVGAVKTPTPQFSALVDAVRINPTWFVPPSIVAESVGALMEQKPKEAVRLGYYRADDGGVRQKPGPKNALGRMKLSMPNPYSVFIHDTPAKANFGLDARALSHGCLRVDDALGFAAAVLDGSWSVDDLDRLADTGATVSIELAEPIPVYVVYFTMMSDGSGALAAYDDVYKLDAGLSASVAESVAIAPGASSAVFSGECAGIAPR